MDLFEMLGLTPRVGLLAVSGTVAAALLVAALRFLGGRRETARGMGLDRVS